ncbi:MAG: tetratricopeptide repeat protein [Elusimicrobiota bacterium]
MRVSIAPSLLTAACLLGCAQPQRKAAPPRPAAADAAARRVDLLRSAGISEAELKRALELDPYGGEAQAAEAIEAYASGEELKAMLLAQAAAGAEPGSGPRRKLLKGLEEKTGIEADPAEILPLPGIVHLELQRAEEAFFAEKYGAAVQACRKALLLEPGNAQAWTRLGSAHHALGDAVSANEAYQKALVFSPKDDELRAFMKERGYLPTEEGSLNR